MIFAITALSLYVTSRMYSVFKEIKNASIRNKILFIDEFKARKYHTHPYTTENYSEIKKWAESKYPKLEYIKSQDLFYTSVMFRNNKNSSE